ncbi:MAG: glutamate racemase, partial [Candidatus Omnitrophota bacterium]
MRDVSNKPIGIFDSGVGGLTVARSVRRCLPCEDIIYFGDTARVPYGNKSRSTIIRFAREIMAFMLRNNVKMVVVACNTASSLGLAALKKDYSIPVIGVIKPGVQEALRVTEKGRVGIIGTNSTIASGAYQKELKKNSPGCRVFVKSCPLFVPLVENRFSAEKVTRDIAEIYLKDMKKNNIDSLILGCTHYPLLKGVIGRIMEGVKLVDSSVAVAEFVKETLEEKGLEARGRRRGRTRYYVSDDP